MAPKRKLPALGSDDGWVSKTQAKEAYCLTDKDVSQQAAADAALALIGSDRVPASAAGGLGGSGGGQPTQGGTAEALPGQQGDSRAGGLPCVHAVHVR